MSGTIAGVRRLAGMIRAHPLAQRHPLAALARIVRWQAESRLRPGPIDKPWIEGARLLVRRGMTGATGNLYFGLHECADMAFLLHFLRPGDLFLDIGANVGSYTVLAGKVAGANVIAFEPHPDTADSLDANIAHNGLGERVTVHRVALSDHAGHGALTDAFDTMNHVLTGEAADADTTARTVTLTTLDAVLAGAHPTMLKIDVEGHEPAVLAGATATIADPALRAIIIETVTPEIEALFVRNGFVERHYDPFRRTLSQHPAGKTRANRLFLRDLSAIEARLRTARRIRAAGSVL